MIRRKTIGFVALVLVGCCAPVALSSTGPGALPPGPAVWVRPLISNGHRSVHLRFRYPPASPENIARHLVPIIEVTGPLVGYTCSVKPVWARLEKIADVPEPRK